jgi:hypothetical protein
LILLYLYLLKQLKNGTKKLAPKFPNFIDTFLFKFNNIDNGKYSEYPPLDPLPRGEGIVSLQRRG